MRVACLSVCMCVFFFNIEEIDFSALKEYESCVFVYVLFFLLLFFVYCFLFYLNYIFYVKNLCSSMT